MALIGERIILREQRRSDIAFLTSLRNDPDTQGWNQALPTDFTEDMLLKRYEKREFSFDPRQALFVIAEKESEALIGSISYTGLQPRWEATVGIQLSKDFWGSGYAFEAQELLLRYLFLDMGLRVVRLWTMSINPRAIKLAERSGFKPGVRLREAAYKWGHRSDNLMMDLLREEYFARHPELTDDLPPL